MIDIGFGIIKIDLGTVILFIGLVALLFDCIFVFFGEHIEKWEFYSEICLSTGIIAIILSFFYFSYSVLTAEYSFVYVYRYVNNDLDFFQRISAIWSGQAGSYFFWTFLAALSYMVFRNLFRKYAHETFFWRSFVLFAFQVAILTTLAFLQEPFKIKEEIVTDGIGLNPSLLNFWNTIHPPIIFIGYALCLIPMVIGIVKISILEDGKVPDFEGKDQLNTFLEFIVSLAWLTLSSGVIIGGYWAYVTLGWGGFWAWDPIETGSLIPWLFLTLYYHGKPFHSKNAFLANYVLSMSYVGTLLTTYLTRSGIITSVHAFQPGGTLERFLKLFIPENSFLMKIIIRIIPNEQLLLPFILFTAIFLALHFLGIRSKEIFRIPIMLSRKDFQASRSRITALKISYITFLIGTYIIIIGLLSPVIYDIVGYLITFSPTGFSSSITVGPLFYNTILTIFGGIMLLAQFFCTYYPRLDIKKKFGLMGGGLIAGVIFSVSGSLYRTGFLGSLIGEESPILTLFNNFWTTSDKANLVIPLLILGMVGLVVEFIKIAMREEKNLIRKSSRIMLHFSFLVILLGALTSANMTITNELIVQKGGEYPIPGTSLTIAILDLDRNFPQTGLHAVEYDTKFMLSAGSRVVGFGISRVAIHKRWANTDSGALHKVTIISDIFADIYIVTSGVFENTITGNFEGTALQIKIIPYINILWAGCLFLHFAIIPLTVGRFIVLKGIFSTKEEEMAKAKTINDESTNENKENNDNGGELNS
ncbi:MAG: cytochrome c biogenesis protein CcsA [Candidatus Hodarchaeota archaeon]